MEPDGEALMIPLARPCFDDAEVEAVRRVLASGWIVQGPEVEAFETEIARVHQAKHCIAVSSGTAALHVCYLALGIGAGDAVFIPSFAWPSAANTAVQAGARPVFVDVLPDTYNMDPTDLTRAVEECAREGWGRPRAVVPVHEFGLAADMDRIGAIASRHGLEVIEDAACALGATWQGRPVGTFGCMGIFSFHPRKSITTGEGGAIVTNDADLAARCREWRNHGQRLLDGRREFVVPGLNYRLTEIQAAIGSAQLAKLHGILEARRFIARHYHRALADCAGMQAPAWQEEHTWQTYMVVLEDSVVRSEVVARLRAGGFETGPGSVAGHLAPPHRAEWELKISERLHYQGLALPLYAGMSLDNADRTSVALRQTLEMSHV